MKNGFTLAEVLITLAVIGIVAVLTIPALIQKHQEKVTVVKLKEVYSILNQAYQLAVIENGTFDKWGMSAYSTDEDGNWSEDFASNYDNIWDFMLPYMKINARCKRSDTDCDSIFKDYKLYSLDGTLKDENNQQAGFILANGVMVTGGYVQTPDCRTNLSKNGSIRLLKNVCADFKVMLEPQKSHYTLGKDSFVFYITKYGILPMGLADDRTVNGNFTEKCNLSSENIYNGYACTAWVIQNGNMDYLHCNDLSWEGKQACGKK